MEFKKVVGCVATLVLTLASALAQESPEATYAKLHSAVLSGNAEAVMAYVAAPTKAELAAKPQAERDALIRSLAQASPKTYTITETTVAPDGNSVVLRGTGISEFQGRAESYLSATFRKEGDAWKATTWSWSNQKPPPAPPKAVAPAASATAAADAASAEPPQLMQKVRKLPAAAATAKPDPAPAPAAAPVAVPKKPSRAHLDARACLKLSSDKAIMACAEKYR